jgi:hypothetical protein
MQKITISRRSIYATAATGVAFESKATPTNGKPFQVKFERKPSAHPIKWRA